MILFKNFSRNRIIDKNNLVFNNLYLSNYGRKMNNTLFGTLIQNIRWYKNNEKYRIIGEKI